MRKDWLYIIHNIFNGQTNDVDLPEVLQQDFQKFAICRKLNEISSPRFWALTLQQIYSDKGEPIPLTSDPPEVYFTFKLIKSYHLSSQTSFGPIRHLHQHMFGTLPSTILTNLNILRFRSQLTQISDARASEGETHTTKGSRLKMISKKRPDSPPAKFKDKKRTKAGESS